MIHLYVRCKRATKYCYVFIRNTFKTVNYVKQYRTRQKTKHQQNYRLKINSVAEGATEIQILKAARLVAVCGTRMNHSVNRRTALLFSPTTSSFTLQRIKPVRTDS